MNSGVLDDTQQKRSGLDQAYDMLARIDEFDRQQAMANIVASLSNHLAEQKPLAEWQADSLVSRLPRALRQLPPLEQLAKMEIYATDATYLEEAILMRKIGSWVVEQKLPPDLVAWLEDDRDALTSDGAEDLRIAYLLFDWTVRNIQLDPLLPEPKQAAGPVGEGATNAPSPLRGLPGPGYMAQPWHTAMTGHGDAWQRARVFVQLSRQQGLDVVMVAKTAPNDANDATPWTCGALVDEQLFLFDPAYGLPIPTADGRGIATLAEVRDNGDLLRALDVDDEHRYPVTGEEVKTVRVFVDASLEALSLRMRLLERDLSGERQLKLTVEPSELAARLRKVAGVSNVTIWPTSIEANLFQIAYLQSPEFDPRLRQAILEERFMIEQRTGENSVAEARYKHLRGQFSTVPGEMGAKEMYVNVRIPEADIQALDTNRAAHEQLGIAEELKRRKNPEDRQALLDSIKASMRRGKDACSYWLGLIHYETGNYHSAVNWLDQRTLKAAGDSRWQPAAHYNLGRAYEQLNAPQLAQEQYLAIESAAQAGALVRAKRLAEKANKR